MFWTTLIRIVIWATFVFLIVQGIGAIIWARYFYGFYTRKHRELDMRIEIVERRLDILKEPPQ